MISEWVVYSYFYCICNISTAYKDRKTFPASSLQAQQQIPIVLHSGSVTVLVEPASTCSAMEAAAEVEDVTVPLFKKRGPKKSSMRRRAATPPPESDSEYSTTDDEAGERRVKRRKRTGGVVTVSNGPGAAAHAADRDLSTTKFSADHSATVQATNDATKQSNWYDDPSQLSAAQLLGSVARRKKDSAAPDSGARYDTAALSAKKKKEDDQSRSVKGPIKAPTNIRTITVTDYSPDVCKDYKQTGWCGFGDSCKFLHAREDYKQGWQLDREWENVAKGKKNLGGTVMSRRGEKEDLDSDEELAQQLEGIPFACIICREDYKYPIVTKCGHYFCEACALKRFRKTPACAACGTGTGGVFNGAKNLKKLLDKKRDQAAKRREKAREAGEEVSDQEEDLPEAQD